MHINVYSSNIDENTGYGVLLNLIKRILNKNNIAVKQIDNFDIINDKVLIFAPAHNLLSFKHCAYFTMWESTHLPHLALHNLNKSDFIINPSNWGVVCFSANGIRVPLYKIGPFYDSNKFEFQEFIEKETFIFGAIGNKESSIRKNLNLIKECFKKADLGDEVKLIVKSDKDIKREEVKEWYKKIDCLIHLSAAEGLGFCVLEALACGRTVISTNYSAQNDYLNEKNAFLINYNYELPNQSPYNNIGLWSKPIEENVIETLKFVANRKILVKQKGIWAADFIKQFNLSSIESPFLNILNKHGYIYA